ncbi:187_t:CDS:2 [Acaulospora morrowiae]|uniref:187_t:CDS:1 n=1 Tax=Acaulospora morrowiae TaxID=94023 RepID=A0A9N9B8H6_9GLOM|nr:187_t:CDS:2 [Acaulospora morrowiae]
MNSSSFHTVTIAGGIGFVGYHITEAFLNDGSYKVKVLQRKPEKQNEKVALLTSKGVEIVYADYNQHDDLVKALQGTDVVISALSPETTSVPFDYEAIQFPLLTAAKEANVKRFIPSEYGFLYSDNTHMITDGKAKLREKIENIGIEYTYFSVGLLQEYVSWLGFDVENKKATFYADENSKISITSVTDIGKYIVESLKMQESRNASIMVAGTTLSLNEILQKYEAATGSKWDVIKDKEAQEPMDQFRVVIQKNGAFDKVDNDKFSFQPRPLTEVNTKM